MTLTAPANTMVLSAADGSMRALESFWRVQPILLFFLRHFGCAICRAELLRLRGHYQEIRALGAEVVAISPERLTATQHFVQRHDLRFPVLCDPERLSYRAFGLSDGSLNEVGGPSVMLHQLREALHGNLPTLNPLDPIRQLGGIFVIDRNGALRFSHVARPIYNYPGFESYAAVLRALNPTGTP